MYAHLRNRPKITWPLNVASEHSKIPFFFFFKKLISIVISFSSLPAFCEHERIEVHEFTLAMVVVGGVRIREATLNILINNPWLGY